MPAEPGVVPGVVTVYVPGENLIGDSGVERPLPYLEALLTW